MWLVSGGGETKMLKRYQFVVFLFLMLITWVCINVSVNLLASSVSTDISDDKKYSLTKQTRNWLDTNVNNIYIRLYVGNLDNNPKLKKYSTDIMLLLEQYQLASNGKISIKTVNVKPFSATEIAAKKAGIEGGEGKPWLGMAISDEKGNFVNIPFLNPDNKMYVEHDITRAITKLNINKKPTIGIMSSEIDIISSSNSLDYTDDWSFVKKLKQDYNVRKVRNNTHVINDDIDVLMIVNPKLLREMTVYAIDQYLVRGGKILLFMDPLSEAAQLANNNNILKAPSGLEVWLFKMGVFYPFDMVIGSIDNSRSLKTQDEKIVKYPFWIEAKKDDFHHPMLNGIKNLKFNYAAPIMLMERENIKQQVLVSAGNNTGEQELDYIAKVTIAESINSFKADNENRLLSVLLEGKFNSLFDEPYLNTEYYVTGEYAYRFLAEKDGKVIVVTDSDFLDEKLWNNENKDRANNFDLLERMIDYLAGNKLISIEEKVNNTQNVSINEKLYNMARDYYAQKKYLLEKQLMSVMAQQTDMYRKIERKELITSVVVANKIESLEKNKYQLREQLEQIEYKIKNLYMIYFIVAIAINVLLAVMILFISMIIVKKNSSYLSKLAERIAKDA